MLMKDYVGKKYGRLKITANLPNNKRHLHKVTAICDCGTIKDYYLSNVTSGKTVSCGCFNRQMSSERYKVLNLSHGLSSHPLSRVYAAMISRCYDANDISYKRYGGKGVTVCDEWLDDFISFYNWAINNGWQEGLQLDKDINGNSKLYSPETCIFVTRKINCRNRTTNNFITHNGQSKTLAEWCEVYNIKNHSMVLGRIQCGWDIKRALETPAKNNGHVNTR